MRKKPHPMWYTELKNFMQDVTARMENRNYLETEIYVGLLQKMADGFPSGERIPRSKDVENFISYTAVDDLSGVLPLTKRFKIMGCLDAEEEVRRMGSELKKLLGNYSKRNWPLIISRAKIEMETSGEYDYKFKVKTGKPPNMRHQTEFGDLSSEKKSGQLKLFPS